MYNVHVHVSRVHAFCTKSSITISWGKAWLHDDQFFKKKAAPLFVLQAQAIETDAPNLHSCRDL